jgi:hypothetical protein
VLHLPVSAFEVCSRVQRRRARKVLSRRRRASSARHDKRIHDLKIGIFHKLLSAVISSGQWAVVLGMYPLFCSDVGALKGACTVRVAAIIAFASFGAVLNGTNHTMSLHYCCLPCPALHHHAKPNESQQHAILVYSHR